MGQNQSRDGIAAAAAAAAVPKAQAVDAYIILRKRADGSSVRELFVVAWRCGFYKVGSTVGITLDCDLLGAEAAAGSGKYISIDAESAALLYKALLNHRMAQAAAAATAPVLAKYADGGFFKM